MATAPAPVSTSAPITSDGKKGKPEKPDYMVEKGLATYESRLDEDGIPKISKSTGEPLLRYVVKDQTRLKIVPSDYSLDMYKPLSKDCFDDDEVFLNFQVAYYNWRKKRIDVQIEEVKDELASYKRFSNSDERDRYNATKRTKNAFAAKLGDLSAEDRITILAELEQQLKQQAG